MINVVLFFVSSFNACLIFSSESESKDEVASSSSIIGAFFKKALATDILCFCPPDNFTPFSPTNVSYPFSNELTKLSMPASLDAL